MAACVWDREGRRPSEKGSFPLRLRLSEGIPVRKESAAAQNIFSTEAVIITKALPDEKIFDSPFASPFAQTSQSSYTETESFSIRSFRMDAEQM